MDVKEYLVNESISASFDLLRKYLDNEYYPNIKLNNRKTAFITKNKVEKETINTSN